MMTNGDPEGQIFLFYPHTINEFFFLLTVFNYLSIYFKKFREVPEYGNMQFHMMTLLVVMGMIAWVR